jgi:hypothetical protein
MGKKAIAFQERLFMEQKSLLQKQNVNIKKASKVLQRLTN